MKSPIANVLCLSAIVLFVAPCNPLAGQESELTFTRDIRPMLSDKCFNCHGNDEETREAGLRLDVREEAIEMEAIVPGSPDESLAYLRMLSNDDDETMPPPRAHKTLSDDEKENFRRWIEQGAVYEQHWSYRPLKRPNVAMAQENKSPIDALIRRELPSRKLTSAGRADSETLVRRLFLDLTGTPPTAADVDAFVADPSDEAWEKLVDRLLSKPAFGERMAVFWLDLVRYADSVGYHADNFMEVSAYRDYVINAFNSNKPFDEFTIEQLAGDLLPDATTEQKIASGYNRLLQTTEEGGAQPKEYISIYAADRVRNVSGVWMGQTMGCAQCHDHKYDPITAKDFYAMSAFFADIKERPVGKREKNLALYTDEEKATLQSLEEKLVAAKKEETDYRDGSDTRVASQAAWEKSLVDAASENDNAQWIIPELINVKVTSGDELKIQSDGSLLSVGKIVNHRNYRFDIEADRKIPAIRLEVLPDESFQIKNGLSRGNGNFVLTGFEVYLGEKKIKIASAKADYEQGTYPAAHAIDDDKKTGWAIDGHHEHDGRRVIIFQFEEPIDLSGEDAKHFQVRMLHESVHAKHNIGRFRISLPTSIDPKSDFAFNGRTGIPEKMRSLLQTGKEQRSEDQQKQLDQCFLQQSRDLVEIHEHQSKLNRQISEIRGSVRTMLVSEPTTPRMTKIRNRGDWMDESGEIVEPAVPEFLPSAIKADGRRLNRLDLANWIVEPSNPLTARTFVNRLWKVFYGRGISNNLDDLGGQGEPPTHPELLDWLAAEFQNEGWDIKRMIKLMVMADTYRQNSIASKESVQLDPGNRWYARQGRWRIDAEFVRDTALQLSGLLNQEEVGGRSVKPYQPAGYWQHLNFPKRKWKSDDGPKLYRKSLYTFWCRSFLHPSMLAFDAPTREECVASRARSNIPQQALVLLNDPIFVEASRGFGSRIMRFEGDTKTKISRAWRGAVNREPTDGEVQILVTLFESQRQRYADAQDDADALASVGDSPVPEGIDVRELAAWTQVARAILNAYETISRH